MTRRITLQCLSSQHKGVLLFNKHLSILSGMEYTLGQRLKIAREHAGKSQAQLAEDVGIRQSAISRIERDEALTTGFASRLAKACGVRTDWLSEEDGEMLAEPDIKDERIKHGMKILEQLKAEYRLDDGIELLTTALKFSQKATGDSRTEPAEGTNGKQ
jgi:transcriptional regulator with XRE-family HTH domain